MQPKIKVKRVEKREVLAMCKAYCLELTERSKEDVKLGFPRWNIRSGGNGQASPFTEHFNYLIQAHKDGNPLDDLLFAYIADAWMGEVLTCKSLSDCKMQIEEVITKACQRASAIIAGKATSLVKKNYWHEDSLASFKKKHAIHAERRALTKLTGGRELEKKSFNKGRL